MKKNNKKTSKVKGNDPTLDETELLAQSINALVQEERKRLKHSLEFFKIANHASYEIALAIYTMSGAICPYQRIIDDFRKTINQIQKSYVEQIHSYQKRQEEFDNSESQ